MSKRNRNNGIHYIIVVFLAMLNLQCATSVDRGLGSIEATMQLRVLSESINPSDLDGIRRLIEAGANVNVENTRGVTPLFVASENGYNEIVKLLLDAKADVDAADTQWPHSAVYRVTGGSGRDRRAATRSRGRCECRQNEWRHSAVQGIPEWSCRDRQASTRRRGLCECG